MIEWIGQKPTAAAAAHELAAPAAFITVNHAPTPGCRCDDRDAAMCEHRERRPA